MTRISPETLHLVSAAMRDTLNHSWESEADKVFHAARWIYELEANLAAAQSDLERERMRLVACGVVALADTPDSAKSAREMLPEYRSASLSDVERRVDECIALRAEETALRDLLTSIRCDIQCAHWHKDIDAAIDAGQGAAHD